jgi:hypothetical protein
MKNIKNRLIIGSSIITLALAAVSWSILYPSQFKIYSNTTYNITFEYPKSLFLSAIISTTTLSTLGDIAFLSVKQNSNHMEDNFFVVSYAPTIESTFFYFKVPETTPKHLDDYVKYYIGHMSDYHNFPKGAQWFRENINGINFYKLTAPGLQSYMNEHSNGIYVLTFSNKTPENKVFTKYIPQILSSFTYNN